MAIPRTVEVHVSRKMSKDYNSTEFSTGITLDLEDGDDPLAVIAEWQARCKDTIRQAFQAKKAEPVAVVKPIVVLPEPEPQYTVQTAEDKMENARSYFQSRAANQGYGILLGNDVYDLYNRFNDGDPSKIPTATDWRRVANLIEPRQDVILDVMASMPNTNAQIAGL